MRLRIGQQGDGAMRPPDVRRQPALQPVLPRVLRGSARVAAALALAALTGCGPQFGAFLYFFGQPPKQTVQAKFKLTTGPLLILFDDSPAVDLPPEMRTLVVRAITDEFTRTGSNERVVPLTRLNERRQTHRELDKRGMREVGRLAQADQVLWLYPREFSMAGAPEQALDPAKLTVVIKVIDAKATERTKVRLWPVSEDGELVSISVPPHEVRAAQSPDALLRTMAQRLAVEVGHLFHDYEEPRPEDK